MNFKQTEIGLIPEDWEVVRLKEVAKYMKAGGTPRRSVKEYWNGDIPFVKIEDITTSNKYILSTKEQITKKGLKNSSAWIVPPNSILLSMYASIGEVALTKFPLATNQAILAIIPNDRTTVDFLYYCLKLHGKRLYSYIVQTTQKNVNRAITENLLIPLPPLSEQQKIARVLDKIQQAIEVQDRIIEQARNLKKSLMQRLFTEGLYGEEQKETEIGLIPKSWKVVKLGEVAKVVRGASPRPKGDPRYFSPKPTAIHWIKISDLSKYKRDKFIINTDEYLTEEGKKKSRFIVKGTLVLSNSGTVGIPAILDIDGCIHDGYLAFLNLKSDILNKEFLYYIFEFYKKKLEKLAPKGTQANLNTNLLRSFSIPLPPLFEQKQIIHILSVVDKKIEVEKRRKEVLKELFKTMLHKLMSGEIRLKEAEV